MISFILMLIILSTMLIVALKIANPLPSRSVLPDDPPRAPGSGSLHKQVAEFAEGRDGETALFMLTDGIDAFAMRLAMAQRAERTIDAQYYIWEDDLSGRILLAAIVAAADRGVRVRLLIDDNPTAGLDPMWAGIVAHPNIAVRLFNPLVIRNARPLNYLFDFSRLNRRMHNKSFTIDAAATVVGGRNVGDAYFGAKDDGLFIDVDALAIGDVVDEVSSEFEEYWASESAYPAESILATEGARSLAKLRQPVYPDQEKATAYREAASAALTTLQLDDPVDAFVWAPVRLVYDSPTKGLGKAKRESLLAVQIAPLFKSAQRKLDLVSGYFVPGDQGTKLLTDLARRGVKMRIATNSIQVTDVPVVHAGYVPYRPVLLAAGANLYEARPLTDSDGRARSLGQTRFSGGGESVHAKTFQIDERIFFVGSFNFDPRSALLNCEMGLVIDSSQLAKGLADVLDRRLSESAYEVTLDGDTRLAWHGEINGQNHIWHKEPGTTAVGRATVSFLSKLPIHWML
ncbi:phospholipase D family protein [Croceicoccus naphthovorans]|uniref:Phospholipase D n=1 Tax=Croceicoccus naphthovorans TaxID=1348774 RepID=A0A0G3XD54_9SPHN|nr:phospholipase D family protein [Croceicoccus naphthovorans]AKM09092.1 hypothetical protein AB433_02520 [Croceicoccus naphthovorans]MBB3991667.1 putative cardiolipin synthase [Croceicoccus naphthovorans]